MSLSHSERLEVLQKCNAAIADGNWDEAYTIMQKIPLPPHLAHVLKELIGSDAVKKTRFNFSAAEQEYGKDWLDQ